MVDVNCVNFPRLVFGTSTLGNLFEDIGYENKKLLIKQIIDVFLLSDDIVMFDSAGKYGAGLALEELGRILQELNIPNNKVLISNKLGWKRIPLNPLTLKPTFESDIWKNIKFDAVQDITINGIQLCFQEGNKLLGNYQATIVSIHDPEEYIYNNTINDIQEIEKRKRNVLDAYHTLYQMKTLGIVSSIGVGSKNLDIIEYLIDIVPLDWIMLACTFTIYNHNKRVFDLLSKLKEKSIEVINAAVFNAGFLIGNFIIIIITIFFLKMNYH